MLAMGRGKRQPNHPFGIKTTTAHAAHQQRLSVRIRSSIGLQDQAGVGHGPEELTPKTQGCIRKFAIVIETAKANTT